MANRHRGEIDACLDGATYRLCLTLGALAELEHAFGAADMVALASRFESGRLRAEDCVRIIGAGLRGAGNDITDEAVSRMHADRGIHGFVEIVAQLLQATFGEKVDASPTPVPVAPTPRQMEEREPARPFPGTKR